MNILEGEKSNLEARHKDGATVAYLQGMSTGAPLKELRENLECVLGAQCFSDEAKTLQKQRASQLGTAVDNLERFVSSLDARIMGIATRADAVRIRESITEQRLLFEGALEAEKVQASLLSCANVEKCLAELERIPVDTFGTRADYDACLNALNGLRASVVGQDVQNSLFNKAEERLRNRAAALTKKASGWLDAMCSRLQGCQNPEQLLAELNQCPEFLPEDRNAELTVLTGQVNQIVADKNEKRKFALEAKQKDEATVAYLRGMSIGAPLKELRENLECVIDAQCFSEEAKSLQKQKETDLQQVITELESFASSLESKLATVLTVADAARVREKITERRRSYAGSPEAHIVEVALTRCGNIEKYLRALAAVPINDFKTPAERDARLNELGQVAASANTQLSISQSQLLSAAEERIRSRSESLTKAASEWVTKMQARVKHCQDPERILGELLHIPEFLPEEKKQEVAAITVQVHRIVDQDACATIRMRFLQIGDAEVRKQLLQDLQELASKGRET
jgi:hypothetical protein